MAHHVFFRLKNPDSKEDRDKLVEGVKTLKNIPTVKEDVSWQVSELMMRWKYKQHYISSLSWS